MVGLKVKRIHTLYVGLDLCAGRKPGNKLEFIACIIKFCMSEIYNVATHVHVQCHVLYKVKQLTI